MWFGGRCDHCAGDLFPGDMDLCFFRNGVKFEPDMNKPVTSEIGVEACQTRCAETVGCEHFSYIDTFSGVGDCHLQAQGADKVGDSSLGIVAGPPRWPAFCKSARRLVRSMVTFGAPAVSHPPLMNPGGRCISGIRLYTENPDLPGGAYGKQEDAAAMWTMFPHAKTPTLVLRKTGTDVLYWPCNDSSSGAFSLAEQVRRPRFEAGVHHDWEIHGISSAYAQRLQNLTIPDDIAPMLRFSVALMEKLRSFAHSIYSGTQDNILAQTRQIANWTLVAFIAVPGRCVDLDRVLVLQHDELECSIVFQGSQGLPDLLSFVESWGTGYCGFSNTHTGVRNELWTITNHPDYNHSIKPKLEKCKSVTCIGHSLGGALCELFTACANSGRRVDPDYQLLAWSPASSPEKLPEVGQGRASFQ